MKLHRQRGNAQTLRVGLFLVLCCLFGILLMPGDMVLATASTLRLSVGEGMLSLDLKPTSANGTFASSDGNIGIGAGTNNSSGYTLKIAAKTAGDRTLSDNNGNGISSLAEPISLAVFSDDSISSAVYSNKWGYLPSKRCAVGGDSTTCADNTTSYFPAPSVTGDILDITNAANTEDEEYTIAIGARADTETKATTYEGTFVVTLVANPIPYTIDYDSNTEDTVTNMPAISSGDAAAETATNAISDMVPVRANYKFLGWCDTTTTVGTNGADVCGGVIYNANGNGNRDYTVDQTSSNNDLVLYAMWQEVHSITFVSGNNINTIMVADGDENWKPYYVNSSATVTKAVPTGTKFIVTVVPEANYILDSWVSTSGSTDNLDSTTLLTTTYTVGSADEILTASGVAGSYIAMQDLDLTANDDVACPVGGSNVTDVRDGKSYTVAKFGNYCYMLSSLRLDNTMDDGSGGTTARVLTNEDSDITPNTTYTGFAMPIETWTSVDQNYYCKAMMALGNGEYYYNWYAARANAYECEDPTMNTNATVENDALALGSICPKGWTLPTYNDVTAAMLWDNGDNPGMLTTSGGLYSGSQDFVGSNGLWWSSSRYDDNSAYGLDFNGTNASRYGRDGYKYYGFPVRCVRSS